jgi:hypothetical protein
MTGQRLTPSRLKELLHYNPETGIFSREIEGSMVPLRPRQKLSVAGCNHVAAKLAWLWVKGRYPTNTIVHLNFDKSDFRFCNLAEASPSQIRVRRKAWGKYEKGVSRSSSKSKPYRVAVHDPRIGRNKSYGNFATMREANAVAKAAYEALYCPLVAAGS